MSTKIVSGASADLLTVDPTSKAARVTLYDTAGNAIDAPPTGSYMVPINIRQTAATAAAATVFAMRNSTGKTCYIRRIYLVQGFDGTSPAATTLRYGIARFSAATPTGGSTIPIIKKRTSYTTSNVTDVRFVDTGLTTTSVTFETEFVSLGLPLYSIQVGAPTTSGACGPVVVNSLMFEKAGQNFDTFELAASEGLCIRILTISTVIGSTLNGFICWDER